MAQIINTAELDPSQLSADENHWLYNGLDCCVTAEVFGNLAATVDDVCRETYEFSKALQAPVLEMNLRGLLINKRRRYEVLKEMRGKLDQLQSNLETILAEGVGVPGLNWRSPAQLSKLFYDVLGLPKQKKRKGDGSYGETTDREAIERLSIYYVAEPICNHILACRDLGKSISFLETASDTDGRMRTNFNIAGTVTGRFSSEYTDFGTGTNLQNVTESLRSVFVADPGMKFANLDLEQGDSRNIGALCWETLVDTPGWNEITAGAYLDACESGDLHSIVTKMTVKDLPWGTAPDKQIAETLFYRHFTYRYMSKKLGHGANYLGKPPELSKQTKLPVSKVKEFHSAYFNAFPCIPAFHEWVFRELERSRCLTTPYGRRRYFFGREREPETRRQAVAHMGQSMTSDNINRGILRLWRANRVQLVLQVHDSILIQFPEEMEDEIVPWALETLQVHLRLRHDRDFFIPTEAKTGWNWGDYAEWTREDFLKGRCRESDIGQCKSNPDGLKKWRGGDSRKRSETDFRLSILGV